MSKRGILIFGKIMRIPRDSIYCVERFGILIPVYFRSENYDTGTPSEAETPQSFALGFVFELKTHLTRYTCSGQVRGQPRYWAKNEPRKPRLRNASGVEASFLLQKWGLGRKKRQETTKNSHKKAPRKAGLRKSTQKAQKSVKKRSKTTRNVSETTRNIPETTRNVQQTTKKWHKKALFFQILNFDTAFF